MHPTAEIKLLIRDSYDFRIKHVSIKIGAFRRDLRIRSLRSSIGATVQKDKFWSTLEPPLIKLKFLFCVCYN
jgi:hypothetical protein